MAKMSLKLLKPGECGVVESNGLRHVYLRIAGAGVNEDVGTPSNVPLVDLASGIVVLMRATVDVQKVDLKFIVNGVNADDGLDYRRQQLLQRGELNCNARLTPDQVRDIRRRYLAGETSQEKLGKEFGYSQSTISGIIHRKIWGHVE